MNINRIIVCTLAVLTLLISVTNVSALVIEKSLKQITIESDTIITGKVVNKESYRENGKIFTDVTVLVEENIKGKTENKIIVQVPGGVVGDIYAQVSDVPLFENNEDVLLFLKGNKVAGWNQGKYTISNDKIIGNDKSVTEFIDNIKQASAENGKKDAEISVASEKIDAGSAIRLPVYDPGFSSGPNDALTNIKSEGFEGTFPNSWKLSGKPTWCSTNFRFFSGKQSGWNACGGSGGVPAGGLYPNNMNSSMIYGPFSLVGATNASVTFNVWTDTELNFDKFLYMASTDGTSFYGNGISGNYTPWKSETFDLRNVYMLGDLHGQPNVWIAFIFKSDGSGQDYGTFLDDIHIQKDLTTSTAPHITNITPDSGSAKALELGSNIAAENSTQVTITGSNFGSLEGKAKFWRIGGISYNATIVSWTDSRIVAKVPGGISSYFKPDGTGNIQIIKDDGTPSDNYGNFRVTYSYNGARWPGSNVTYKINPNTPDTDGELAAVKAAANVWNNSGANFEFKYGGLSNKTSVSQDGENSIIWVNYDTGSIATTTTYWNMTDYNRIIENDLEFNDLTLNWDNAGSLTMMDVQTIATHELGHFLGFADMYGTADNAKIMNGYGSEGTIKRNLTKDDISGIKRIYGSKSIKVKYPNGQEIWVRGNTYTINWSSKGNLGPDVKIQLLKNKSVVEVVTSNTPNDGSYDWIVPSNRTAGNDYKIRVTSKSNSAYRDTSNKNFTIE
ncbi:MAG: hypothetical protein C3F06_05165 [Candidatus Methanoperedenaceae archaeon]|nr:MAG: hypothetical protein C3F06_05165 [Candidatus Methanoperedenaceae archaeon]